MATVEMPVDVVPQNVTALRRANRSRVGGAEVKALLKRGDMMITDAIRDERAGVLTVLELLMAQPRWGYQRASRLLAQEATADPVNRISESRRVRDLTSRQRDLLASWCSS